MNSMIICKDGRRVALEVSTHIISRDGKPVGVQGIARDITERKKTEEALQQAKQNLEAWVHELEQRTREMTLLSEMGDMLRACLTTDEAYTVIVRVAQQIFPVQVGALYVISPARNLVEAVAVWGDASLIERVFAPDECWALRRGRVHWVEDSSVGLLCKHLHQPPPEGYLCVPMMAQSQALGILLLTQPRERTADRSQAAAGLAMAEHIAMALSNLKLHETLRSQSIRDPLTGLFNRRFMEESLELELRRAARNRRPLGMIMLEIDDFQALSRSFGEDAEDSVLLEIGQSAADHHPQGRHRLPLRGRKIHHCPAARKPGSYRAEGGELAREWSRTSRSGTGAAPSAMSHFPRASQASPIRDEPSRPSSARPMPPSSAPNRKAATASSSPNNRGNRMPDPKIEGKATTFGIGIGIAIAVPIGLPSPKKPIAIAIRPR